MLPFLLGVVLVSFACGRVPYASKPVPVWDGRIVGGRNATIEEFPYQLSLEVYGRHSCGASLIQPNVAVTAAHCTKDLHPHITGLSVRSGSTIRESGGQVAGVVGICDHPKFDVYDFDVSVLLLERSFALNTRTQLISLQPVGEEVPAGTFATVTGWGDTSFGGEKSHVLQAVEVPKIKDSTCAAYYPEEEITPRMTCYGYEEGRKDACQGDSGGPLVTGGKLVGIVSWGYGCAFPKRPNVYTKVSDVEIQEHISQCTRRFQVRPANSYVD